MLGQAYFFVLAAIAVFCALVTVAAKNPIRGAMGLLGLILSIAGLFLALRAEFLAAIQLIVYAGAIVILFLFVIMLLGPDAIPEPDRRGRTWRSIGGTAFALLFAGGLGIAFKFTEQTSGLTPITSNFGGIDAIGKAVFTEYLVPFELSSALIMVAIVGAMAVARGRQSAAKQLLQGHGEGTESVQPETGLQEDGL